MRTLSALLKKKARRRDILQFILGSGLGLLYASKKVNASPVAPAKRLTTQSNKPSPRDHEIKLFLCGDVMTGRGIDQILPYSSTPELYEPYIRHAAAYVELAERLNGPIPKPVDFDYVWGDAIAILGLESPDARIINLETAVTTSAEFWPGKGINYRMHPLNTRCLTATGIDCCALANNHLLDWGYAGLKETVSVLHRAGIATAGAGKDIGEAESPAILSIPGKGRVVVFSLGHRSSGIPRSWAATENRPGVMLIPDLSADTVGRIAARVETVRKERDIVVASIHWGGNWGYEISDDHVRFAHALIEYAGVDLVHGHSSHHAKGVEIYRGKPIIYGCGDFLNDYEGIGGHERFRGDLSLMYLPTMDVSSGTLKRFDMLPTRVRRFRIEQASKDEAVWLQRMLIREGRRFETSARLDAKNRLSLEWRS